MLFLCETIVVASHEMMANGVKHRCAASGGPCVAQGHRATAHAARCTADCPNRVKGARRPRTRGLKHPRSALVRVHPQRVKLVNVSNECADGMEHDEAVKMVNFSRSKKRAKCDLDMNLRKSLVPDLWSPGSRPGVRYGDIFRI